MTRKQRVPGPLTSFVGRAREVESIAALLDGGARLVTLTGPGGVGKTRLALRIADLAEQKRGGRVQIVPLADVSGPEFVVPAIAAAVGVRESGDQDATERLAEALADRDLLLVIDNFEHVIDAAPLLAELLVASPHLRLLVTSRVPLRISGEQVCPVDPLGVPALTRDADAVATSEAGRLFLERARAVDPGFVLTERNAHAVASICARLDGLPLAIELAAARVRHLPPAALLEHLEKRLPLLTGGARDLPPRQRAMRDTIGWSYEQLDAAEQALFRRLAVFVGGFALPEAAAVCGATDELDVLDGISSLVDKSLVRQQEGGEPRYRMLEVIREYGLERLEVAGEEGAVRRAHAACFLALAEHAEQRVLTAGEQAAWLNRLDHDHENFRAALAWFLEDGNAEAALRLTGSLAFFWYYRGHLTEGRRALERALAVADDAQDLAARRAWALTGIGLLATAQGDLREATSRLIAAIEEWGTSEAWGAAAARGLLGGVFVGQERYNEAALLFEESLARFTQLGNEAWVAHARFHLGAIAYARGDHARARAECRAAADGYDAAKWRLDAIDPIRYLGLLACAEGDLAEAAALFADNLARLEERGSPSAIGTGLTDVATFAVRRGAVREAARLFGAADAMLRAERATLSLPARTVYEAAMAKARELLGERSYEIEHAAGHALTLEQAVAEAAEILGTGSTDYAAAPDSGLTERELDVLRLLVAGKTNPEIADTLFIGPGTVRNHVSHILAKLGARTRTEAAALARQQGLV